MSEQQPAEGIATAVPDCPKCEGAMWDNRLEKRNPKAPDFKCKDKGCDGVIWPPRSATPAASAPAAGAAPAGGKPAQAGGGVSTDGMPLCPICGGAMWDDRLSKRNPKAPDFKCKNKPKERGGPGCEGIIWPPRDGAASPYPQSGARGKSGAGSGASAPPYNDAPPHHAPPPFDDAPPFDDDDLPF